MALPTRTFSILASGTLSVVMIGAAFYFSSSTTLTADAQSTSELLRAYARQDADADGLADWQEELYGTDIANSNSVNADMTDKEAVEAGLVAPKFVSDVSLLDPLTDESMPGIKAAPDTLTDRFAREFFADYLSNPGGIPTEDDLLSFVDSSINELASENNPKNGYLSTVLTTVPDSSEAYALYAATMERAIAENAIDANEGELVYLANLVHGRAGAGTTELTKISKAYSNAAKSLSKVTVPKGAAAGHLRVINALHKMGVVVDNFTKYESDPLLAVVYVSAYEPTITELGNAFGAIYPAFAAQDAVIEEETPGYSFYLMLKIIASQKK